MAISNYFLPAILLNPVVVLHSINTYIHYAYPSNTDISPSSPHAYLSPLGPSTRPFLDIHDREDLCWTYTLIMVCAQVLAYLNVGTNREEKKARSPRHASSGGSGSNRRSESDEKEASYFDAGTRERTTEREDLGIQSPVLTQLHRRDNKSLDLTHVGAANSTLLPSPNRRITRSMRLVRKIDQNQENMGIGQQLARHRKKKEKVFEHSKVEEVEVGIEAGDISDEDDKDDVTSDGSTSCTSEEEIGIII